MSVGKIWMSTGKIRMLDGLVSTHCNIFLSPSLWFEPIVMVSDRGLQVPSDSCVAAVLKEADGSDAKSSTQQFCARRTGEFKLSRLDVFYYIDYAFS
jgi:hypothetical protein